MKLVSVTTTHVSRKTNCNSLQPLAFYYSIRNAKLILKKHNNLFSKCSYLVYLFIMFILIFKYINDFYLFKSIIKNYYFGLIDSFSNRYYRKE
jgi:hypothetical protein